MLLSAHNGSDFFVDVLIGRWLQLTEQGGDYHIAVAGNKAWQQLAEKVMSRFVNAKAHFFDGDDFKGAAAWVKE